MSKKIVNLSSLSPETKVIVEDDTVVSNVAEILDELDFFKDKNVYTVEPFEASFNAVEVLDEAIESVAESMYEDWSPTIKERDIEEMQEILDRILSRNKDMNVTYYPDALINLDA